MTNTNEDRVRALVEGLKLLACSDTSSELSAVDHVAWEAAVELEAMSASIQHDHLVRLKGERDAAEFLLALRAACAGRSAARLILGSKASENYRLRAVGAEASLTAAQERVGELENLTRKNLGTMGWSAQRLREFGKSTEELDTAISETEALLTPVALEGDQGDMSAQSHPSGAASALPADDWIEWKGGENPAPGKAVEVRFRRRVPAIAPRKTDSLFWDHTGGYGDIIAYRILTPTPRSLQGPGSGGGETCVRCGEPLVTGPWGFTDCPACNPNPALERHP